MDEKAGRVQRKRKAPSAWIALLGGVLAGLSVECWSGEGIFVAVPVALLVNLASWIAAEISYRWISSQRSKRGILVLIVVMLAVGPAFWLRWNLRQEAFEQAFEAPIPAGIHDLRVVRFIAAGDALILMHFWIEPAQMQSLVARMDAPDEPASRNPISAYQAGVTSWEECWRELLPGEIGPSWWVPGTPMKSPVYLRSVESESKLQLLWDTATGEVYVKIIDAPLVPGGV